MALNIEQRIRLITGLSAEIEEVLAACLPAQADRAGERLKRLVSSLRLSTSALDQDCGVCARAYENREFQQLARFAAHAPGYFYTLVKTADGRWFMPFASAGIVETFGVYPEDVANSLDVINTVVVHPDDLGPLMAASEKSAQEMSPFQFEYRIRHPRKGERWIELRSQPLPHPGPEGGVVWHGFGHDVTMRKKVENTLRFVAQRDGISEADEFLTALARHLGEALAVDYVVIDRLAAEGIAETVALFAKGSIMPNLRYELRDTPCDNVMGKSLCCYQNNVQARFPGDQMLVDMGADSYLGIPLWDSAGQAIGLIAVMDGKPLADECMAEQLLQVVAPAVAAILEKQRSEGARQESERSFRALAENLPDHVARWDLDLRYVYVNPAQERLLGKSAAELIGKEIEAFTSERRFHEALRRVSTSGQPMTFVINLPMDESRRHEIRLIPERDGRGKVVGVLGIGRDVTEQLQMQEAVQASERQYRSLTENLPNMVARYDLEARIVYLSPKLEQHLNCSLAETRGRTPNECWPDGSYADYQALLLQVARTGAEAEMEISAMDADLGMRLYQLQFVAERDEQGRIASVLVISHDITERRRNEADTRMAASVFDAAGEGIVITDPEGKILKVNRAFGGICGYGLAEAAGRHLLLIDKAFHEDSFYADIWARVEKNGDWEGELECCRKNGDPYTKRLSISSVRDDQGRALHYVGIFSDISQIKRHEVQLRYIAHHDTLTGLPNRILLMDRLQLGIAQARRSGKILGVLFIDLDGFKPINDRLGHKAGDQTLIEMGHRMTRGLRAGDTVARLGGDEFVVLLPGLSDVEECESSTRRLIHAIGEPIDLCGSRFTLSASIGIALFPRDADDADSLLRRADEAMYVAKRTGRSQYVFCSYDADGGRMDGSSVHDLRVALEQDQIEVHYQPIVDLRTGQVTKAEALVRWRHPERGLVPPGEFIPVAESTGLIHAIGTRVFSKAVATALAWNRLCPGSKPHRISVNRSPREFMSPDGVAGWLEVLQGQEKAARMLSVEITEGLLLDDQPKVLNQLKQLRALGMTIALDDFGTGFSSLAYLKKFDIDYLKIDRSFVLDIVDDPSDRVIVESVIAMARHLGIRLIAEGVETTAQAALLVASRCDYAQGYLYARPLPEKEFLEFVQAVERSPLELPAPEALVG